jgi:uncharacterized protein
MRLSLLPALLLAATALAGCASQTADFYTLSVEARADSARPASAFSVVVGATTVPELIDRPQIVVHGGTNQVDIDEFARWAEPLKSQIPRVIAGNLAQLLNSQRVSVYPDIGEAASAYRVRANVERFDAQPGEAVIVDVVWTVSPPGNGAPQGAPLSGRSIVRESVAGPGYGPLVAAWSRALGTVSGDIAAAIRPGSAP